jgi:NADH-ubiquinone oxidoreductase chain 5
LFQNRLGDVFFVFFILYLVDIRITHGLYVKTGLVFLIIGRSVKRAQFPFNAWLLAAIRAPTPISSLVHSSTLVVAGVYILLQFSYCLLDVLIVLKYLSLLTLLIRTFGLVNELDIKKLIAYSTIRHVSLIMFIIRFKLIKIVYFHLNIHAMFKSLIFICFGFVILISFHAQDKRLVSLLIMHPFIKIIYYFSCFCLAGLPILSAFFSKDFIIEYLISSRLELSFILLVICFLRVRIYYRIKLLRLGVVHFSLRNFEFNSLGIVRVLIMTLLILLFINIFITFIFSLSLEVLRNKFFVYVFVLILFFLSLYSNLNFKLFSYTKFLNFKEL